MTANSGEPTSSQAPETPRRGRIPADTLANRLVLARRLAGMTINEAAEAAGLVGSSWANWENGRRPHGETDVVGAIAEALDVDFHWLLFGGPLEGPKGRPVRRTQAERQGRDTGQYATVPVRPMPGRPMSRGPKGRTDRRTPKTGRPVIVCEPTAGIGDVLADVE